MQTAFFVLLRTNFPSMYPLRPIIKNPIWPKQCLIIRAIALYSIGRALSWWKQQVTRRSHVVAKVLCKLRFSTSRYLCITRLLLYLFWLRSPCTCRRDSCECRCESGGRHHFQSPFLQHYQGSTINVLFIPDSMRSNHFYATAFF